MGRLVYLSLLLICAAVTASIYREEISALMPWERIGNKRREFEKTLIRISARKKSTRFDKELFNSSITLKNLSLVRKETPISADYIYERLMENSNRLRPIYSEMLTLYRTGHDEEAFKMLAMEVGTKSAKNFANILSKLDRINPAELTEQMEMFQQMMTDSAMTAAMKKAQRNSAIITACAATSVFALLINFTVVVVFTDAMSVLNNLFL